MRHPVKESTDTESPDLVKELLELEVTISSLVTSMQKYRKRIDCFYYESQSEQPQFKENTNYYSEFWKTFIINQFMVTQLKDLSQNVTQFEADIKRMQVLGEQYVELYKQKNKKKNRRLASQISKQFKCQYDNCYKVYGTDVSLNLHMKIKHNGGNKTERQTLARQYVRAMKLNLPLPQITITFPPGYLDTFAQQFQRTQSPHS